ncbi:uncharacterized protein LOC131251832 isoform X2 [Magnolia sinica]|uniref:uncharacterized protein LOC131251832 isoform X2 n=1 Tax=Magnolia sinica TaxID=86752 RepID=UPI0026583503|nr:uncharacterized protein LOC131251832 isoform X2 [Magnolia sinica]
MLCLKAEALGNEVFGSHGVILPMSLGSSIQRYLKRGGRDSRLSSASSSGDGSPISTALEEVKTPGATKGRESGGKMRLYRFQLEKDVQKLQKELQEEIDLHFALANAVAQTSAPLSDSPSQIPVKAQELLSNIAVLEITVLKLEEELIALHFQLSQERNERRLTEYHLRHLLSPLPSPRPYSPTVSEEPISPQRVSKHSGLRISHSLESYFSADCGHSQSITISRPSDVCSAKENSGSCSRDKQETETDIPLLRPDGLEETTKDFLVKDLSHHPNQLSEEMVRCMRDIFLCLADSSSLSSKFSSSEHMPSPLSPQGHLSCSSMLSFSDSSIVPSSVRSPTVELQCSCEVMVAENAFVPYKIHEKVNWINIGRYSSAAEVSWMSVGKNQLEYAAAALKRFRVLVEQLAKVNLACMNGNEKLAFWINLYNALIMHAYLAYGVPKSDIKLFSLMQKASYTVGGHSFSAADIEYIILKMKPPTHRPQIALVLALHKFKISEEQRKYSIDNPEPLVAFALSCGMYSSPALRIFKADNVIEELHDSLRDYIHASVGISSKGKLLVPKLLHCYAKGVVEDSLLADWICRFLSPEQAAMVRDCTSHRKQRLLGARSFGIIPFDSRFRYLFLLENGSSQSSS